MTDPHPPDLRSLPALPQQPDRHRATRLRAGEAFEQAHRRRIWTLNTTRVLFGVALTGAVALYLLWAMRVARTFG